LLHPSGEGNLFIDHGSLFLGGFLDANDIVAFVLVA
jgi:hypothetical protein